MSLGEFMTAIFLFGIFFFIGGFACAYYLAKEKFFEKYWKRGL